jgi:hypothetical protein
LPFLFFLHPGGWILAFVVAVLIRGVSSGASAFALWLACGVILYFVVMLPKIVLTVGRSRKKDIGPETLGRDDHGG